MLYALFLALFRDTSNLFMEIPFKNTSFQKENAKVSWVKTHNNLTKHELHQWICMHHIIPMTSTADAVNILK